MSYTFAALEAEYTGLLQRMVITRPNEVDRVARKLLEYIDQKRYAAACNEVGVPQIVAAASFEREASSNFQDGPAQGDPWNERSHNWPPCGPFGSWTEAAVWAYRHEGFDKIGAANWSWERSCYEEELFNGFGPLATKALITVSSLFAQPVTGSEGDKIVGSTLPQNLTNNDGD